MRHEYRNLFHIIIFIGLAACGVNTGNPRKPKDTLGGTPATKAPDTTPGTSLVLSLKDVPGGQVIFNVKRVDLIPSGEGLLSGKINSIVLPSVTKMRSGQTITLFSKQTVPSGSYDRISLVLDESAPAVFLDANQKENKIAIAPYRYYTSSGEAINTTQVVLALAEKKFVIDPNENNNVTLDTDLAGTLRSFADISATAFDYYKSLNQLDYLYTLDPTAQGVEVKTSTTSSSQSSSTSTSTSPSAKGKVSLEINVLIDYTPTKYICLYNQAQALPQTTILLDTACVKASAIAELTQTSGTEYAAFVLASGSYDVVLRTVNRDVSFLSSVTVDNVTTSVVTYPVDTTLREKH